MTSSGRTGASPPVVRTVCPRNCYGTCGMLVTVRNGRISAIEGDPKNTATGGHVCVKGLAYARAIEHPDRVLRPLRRRRSGSFEPVSWGAAAQEIAERLERLRRALGPQSILYYEGSGSHGSLNELSHAFWRQFGGCSRTFGDLCWPAGLEATRLTYGANLHNHPRLTRESRFILVWGHNPAETNIHQMRLIQDAKDRGALVAVVDPRGTDTSDFADMHLRPIPGTDAALALGMAAVIVDRGLEDNEFLREHAAGFEAFRERLRQYRLDAVARETGLPAEAIERLAIAYASTRPALLIAGFGLQRRRHAGQTIRAVALLPALTGNIGVAGGGWQYANLASHCLRPVPLPADTGGTRDALPVSRLSRIADIDNPPIGGVWIERGNPASQHPRADRVRAALDRLDLVVVVDQFLTETARHAHFVLPAKTMFEEEDLVTAYWHPYLQKRAKIFDRPGEVKTETEIWRLLAEQFGFDTAWFPADTREILRQIIPPDRPDLLDALEEGPVDLSPSEVAFADRRFRTPSGRIEFESEQAHRLWGVDPLPDCQPLSDVNPTASRQACPLHLLSCKTRDRLHSQFANVAWLDEVARPHRLDMHPHDAAVRSLEEGEHATVWNDRGRLTIRVHLDHGLRPGVVHILEGGGPESPDVNRLTDDGVTDMNHGATFYECLVEVAKA